MTSRVPQLLVASALAGALLVAPPALGDGVPVAPRFGGHQDRPALAADGAGGAWIGFKAGSDSIGLYHLSSRGLVDGRGPDGILRTGLSFIAADGLRVLSDSPDRVYVVADASYNSRLADAWDGAGHPLPGYPVSTTLFYTSPGAVLDPADRLLVGLPAYYGSGAYGVRYGIVDPAGVVLQETESLMIYQPVSVGETQAVTDGTGGMYVTYPNYSSTDYSTGLDIAIQHVAADGTTPWGVAGRLACAANAFQTDMRLAPDGSGGVYVSWTDERTNPPASPQDIYASHYDAAGTRVTGWGSTGNRVGAAAGAQFESRIASDGGGGIWILWRDERVSDIDLYFTHVVPNGTFATGFGAAGRLLCGATGGASSPLIAADGEGGFFAAWLDVRAGGGGLYDVYASHVTIAGVPAAGWPADGLALCDDPAVQSHLALVATGPGHAIVAWRDGREPLGQVRAVALEDSGVVTAGVGPRPTAALRLRAAASPVAGAPDLWLAAPQGSIVSVDLTDVSGRLAGRVSVVAGAGETPVRFAGGPFAPGIYFARARLGAAAAVARLCVLR